MIKARKQFGQHWLKNEKVLDCILEASRLKGDDRVLEIGPGTGILTRQLLIYAESLLAVEIDRDLCRKLVKNLGDRPNFLLLEGDFLSLDIPNTIKNFPLFQNQNKVVANIPYNITGPILEKLLGKISQPATTNYESIVLLIQKEVGERLVATPDSKTFGALSVRVQYLADCELICHVPAKSFSPPPKVDSVVVKLSPRSIANPANNPKQLDSLVKVGFSNKRKMLRNNLKSIIELDRLNSILEKLAIDPEIRAENLSVSDWVNLCNSLNYEIFSYSAIC
jgi:16S rRNA (adenine1518-N6/adenine1519-N6)-dimethyltransferase